MKTKAELQRDILRKRGLKVNSAHGKGGVVKRERILNLRRSAAVTLVEHHYGANLEEIIEKYHPNKIVEDTGVSRVTIWRWKKLISA